MAASTSSRTALTTQVGIIGGGPAGLLLSHLLRLQGIESVVLERRDREYTVQRVRAGVIEHGSAQLLAEAGIGDRLHREGLEHRGIYLQYNGTRHHIPFDELVGHGVWIYGQQQVVRDLIDAHDAAGTPARYEVSDVLPFDLTTERPGIRFRHEGTAYELRCDIVVGADGFHGVSRRSVPARAMTAYERDYPFGWLGILAHVPPSVDEICYSLHDNGFGMHSMRSPEISRLYLQVDPHDTLDNWPDSRIWDELDTRLGTPGWTLQRGEIFDRGITPMRSFVASTMRYGRLFLVGDAGHIVPPTGAKGLNLAISDVHMLRDALVDWYTTGSNGGLDAYSDAVLRRVWRIQHFSNWMTRMLHRFHEGSGADAEAHAVFDYHVQLGQLDHLCSSRNGMSYLAEFYTGLPVPSLRDA